MRHLFLLPILVMGLVVSCGKNSSSSPSSGAQTERQTQDPGLEEVQAFQRQYLRIMNDYRESIGLKALKPNPIIASVAGVHAEAMGLRRRVFGHAGLGNRCKEIRARLKLAPGTLCGEILAFGQQTPEDVFKAWYNSPDHRGALEKAEYTHTGIGYFVNESGRPYWSQMFMKMEVISF